MLTSVCLCLCVRTPYLSKLYDNVTNKINSICFDIRQLQCFITLDVFR